MSETTYTDDSKTGHALTWQMLLIDDPNNDRPDDRDDGFWPSHEPDAAGYVEPDNFEAARAEATSRMDRWESGDWNYVGVVARATLRIAVGQNTSCLITINSPGVWGIESDAGDYLATVFNEERETLRNMLKDFGAALAAGEVNERLNPLTGYSDD